MWINRIIWKYFIKRIARAHGFLDPMALLSRLSRFAQPSEVMAPSELLRAGAIMHARGLINSQAIQHNLDWIWPYWVECQFNPHNIAFVPRAFSITHINLTHRNWTAVGLPDSSVTPIVDPRGLVTPFWDSWSVDAWVVAADGRKLIPSQEPHADQVLLTAGSLAVSTKLEHDRLVLHSHVETVREQDRILLRIVYEAQSDAPASLIISLRPYNPEGISFIESMEQLDREPGWKVNQKDSVLLSERPECFRMSKYSDGDVYHRLDGQDTIQKLRCEVGMATACAVYAVEPGSTRKITATILLRMEKQSRYSEQMPREANWRDVLSPCPQLIIPDDKFKKIFDASVRALILHSVYDVYAGPYTYKRFWFRDAVFILHTLLCLGLVGRVEYHLARFRERQTAHGYFLSQEGEWDSNGEVLWLLDQYCRMTGKKLPEQLYHSAIKAAHWIVRKRLSETSSQVHAGLMPAGFSAEHLGPNDYYYWDNFWSLAGLRSAAEIARRQGSDALGDRFSAESDRMSKSIENSLEKVGRRLGDAVIPASPYRRMDSGAIGSLACGYPLQLYRADDPRLLNTAKYLFDQCLVDGAFFHDFSHSGINPYLTLHLAQVFLRAGDNRYFGLMKSISDLASTTGNWPEAIHPLTKGGCMGDAHHVWAAAEWVMMIRSCFIREESDDTLVLCSGIPESWQRSNTPMLFGPTLTSFGSLSVNTKPTPQGLEVSWEAQWSRKPAKIRIAFPSQPPYEVTADVTLCFIPFQA